jgi:magnesium chelatase subunit D
VSSVAVLPTLRAAASRGSPNGALPVGTADLREPVREARTGNLLVLAVDASGSMGVERRMASVKGALLGLLLEAYQRRDRVALVTFAGGGADVVLRPTGSIEVARRRLADLPTGGDTPLAEGVQVAADVAVRGASPTLRPLLVVVTDGRATAGADPWGRACDAARAVRRRGLASVVVDVEAGPARLGLAHELALVLGARHVPFPEFTTPGLRAVLDGALSISTAAQ